MKSIQPAFSFALAQPRALPCTTSLADVGRPGALAREAVNAVDAAAHQRLQELLAQLPVAMYLLRGPAQIIDLVNLPAAASWGRAVDEVRGQPFFEALPALRGQGYEAAYATVWQTQQAVKWREARITLVRAAGEPAGPGYFDVSFQPFHEGAGRLAGILVTSCDVTEQVRARQLVHHATAELAATNAGLADYVRELTQTAHAAQQHAEAQAAGLAQLLEQVPVAIGLLVGPDYLVEVCNPGLRARWGRSLAQVQHRPLFEVLPELQGQGLRALLEEVGRTGVPAVAHPLPGPGGSSTTPSSFSYYPLRDAQGQTIAIAAVAAGANPTS